MATGRDTTTTEAVTTGYVVTAAHSESITTSIQVCAIGVRVSMSSCLASQTTWHCSASERLVSLLQLYFLTNIHSSCIGDASTLHKCPSACRIRRLWRQPLLRMRNERWVQSGGKRTTIMSIIKLRASPSAYHHHNHHITITITSGHTRMVHHSATDESQQSFQSAAGSETYSTETSSRPQSCRQSS